MLLTELLENLLGRTESRRRRDRKQFHVAQIAEAVEERCLLSGTYGGYEYHEFPPAAAGSGNTGASQGAMNPLTSIPQLSSLPGAPVTIYLDFDGHTETQDWPGARSDGQTGAIITPVFDIDNDFTTFSDEELRLIEEVWYRVAEDYAPFNVNVTTIDPGSYNDFSAVLVSIGGNGSWIGSPGGIAFVNSFNNSAVNTCYVFSDNTAFGSPIHAKGMALAASHEVGHMLGLLHHSVYDANGNQTAQYDSGRPDLGPIMGAPYNSERETWSSAPDSNGPTSIQDDLVYMTRAQNLTFAFRQDDHGNSISNATPLDSTVPDVSGSGIIERNDDVDFFSFETDTGTVSFDATGLDLAAIYSGLNVNAGTNLDLVLSLYDSNGTLIATDNPTNSLSASLSASVSAGTYYIAVSGTGQYGALGSYTLSGTVIPLPTIPTMLSPTGTLSILNPTFQWSQGSGATSYELEVANLTLNRSRYYVRTVSGTTHVAQFAFVEGDYTARVRTIAADGTLGTWSNTIAFTLDVPAPSKPIISRPLGEIATSFPTFVWNSQAAAFNYTLEVRNADTDERVIFRTNHEPNTYLHFNPLPDGNYVATVQAFNILGEASAVSDPVAFSIDSPPPVAPTITGPTATTTNTSPRIEWTEVQDAWRYDLWVNYRNGGVAQYIRETKIEGDNFYQTLDLPQGTYI
ncbi:MAG: pre-peptidase C-terminal domain-containing protein, partial [Planctomycetaceae bacterium]|nr:pre-peptidase C-terminal domain-containing protein [Planctomycetaceae bacterium]